MKKQFLLLLLFFVTFFVGAPIQSRAVTSTVTFKIKNAGITVDGSLGGIATLIKFDATNYAKSTIEASVDVNTLNTGIDLRNNHLKKEEYFNASKYPKIFLKSTFFSKEKNGSYKGFFKLTMKGITKEVVIPFTYTLVGNVALFKAAFTLNRRDYTVGGKSWTLADEVAINLVIYASK